MYFFDTQTLIEIIKGNKNYKKFKDCKLITGILNIGELYWILLKEYDKKTADYWCKSINFDLIDLNPDLVFGAIYFRFLNRNKKLSLINCIGYITALQYGFKFLTGDKEFEGMKRVKFVK